MDWKSRIHAAMSAADSPLPEDDIIEELAQHARAMYDAARADGLSDADADRRVTAQIERWRLESQALRRTRRRSPVVEAPAAAPASSVTGLLHDLRYAARLMRRQPRYAAIVAATMALGIGATTVLFSVCYGVLMKPLPWPHADRLVVLKETRGGKAPRFGAFTNTAYTAWSGEAAAIDDLAAWSQRTVTMADGRPNGGDAERIRITAASASLFSVLELRPLVGSLFAARDEQAANGAVVVLSERLWRRRFGGDPAALGRIVRIDGEPHSIVGVLPEAAAWPSPQSEAFVPFHVPPPSGNLLSLFNAVARLRPGATPAQAAADGTARGRFAAKTGMTTMAIFGGDGPIQVSATPLRDALTLEVRRPLIVLLVAVGLLLLTATANVASLQLARATTRGREMAIRAALGAGSGRVMRQLLVESLLLGLTGGAAGLLLAWLVHRAMPALLPADFPRVDSLGMDAPVVLFAVAVSVLTSLVFGVLPALRVRRLDLVESLSQDGASSVGAARRSRTAQARVAIIGAQVAIACVLLVGASLLGRSFVAILSADRGYEAAGVLTARLSMPGAMYTPERRYAMLGEILSRLNANPAIAHAAFTSEMPLTPGGSTSAFTLRSRRDGGAVISVQASPRIVSARALQALRMRVIAGRGFAESDTEASPPVAIVNRAFARAYLGDQPLGMRVPMAVGYQNDGVEATVVGVVDDVRYLTAADSSLPELYYSMRQLGKLPVQTVTLLVRTAGDPLALVPALRTAIREADSDLVPEAVTTLEDRMLTSLARPRLYVILLAGFAGSALLIAAVGLFAVLSYTVAQRSRELAVRAALGARPIDMARLVLTQGLTVTAVGLVAGLLGSLVLMRSIEALLYGTTAHDGVTYLVVPALLTFVAVIACLVPAARAARLDPLEALRG